jgi:HTH-type transcriptional regulator / antitoxin HigA
MDSHTDPRYEGRSRDSYLALVSAFHVASIRSDEHLSEAQRVIDRLLGRGELDAGEEIYVETISDLVACYEDAHHPIGPASDADMFRHLLEAEGVTQAELSRERHLRVHDLRSAVRKATS